jgi:hypothetical protein
MLGPVQRLGFFAQKNKTKYGSKVQLELAI